MRMTVSHVRMHVQKQEKESQYTAGSFSCFYHVITVFAGNAHWVKSLMFMHQTDHCKDDADQKHSSLFHAIF